VKILTENNITYDLVNIPSPDKDIRYCVLDYSDQNNVDYYFMPLVFLESFNSPCVDIKIGPYNIQMPLDWSIVIGDINIGELEVMPLIYLNDKDFDIFTFNPISGYMPKYLKFEIINIWMDVKWYFPKLKNGHFLAVPLSTGTAPLCALFIKDISKVPESLDIRKIF
jgi:hypothetical protein